MNTQIDFEFQVNQTIIHILYDDPTHVVADALVSSDDVYLSASGGISKMIWKAAGKNHLRRDIRNFSLPVPMGSVVLTGAGNLKSKYIFHVAMLDFATQVEPKRVVPNVVHRVFDIANSLMLESIVTPSFVIYPSKSKRHQTPVSQLSGVPEKNLLELLLRSCACYFAMKRSSIKKMFLVIYDDSSLNHQASEQQFTESITDLLNQLEEWKQKSNILNMRLAHLLPLVDLVTEDEDFRTSIQKNISFNREELHKVFLEPSLSSAGPDDNLGNMNNELNKQELIQRVERLEGILQHFNEEIKFQEDLISTYERRLEKRKLQEAYSGINTEAEVLMEIEDIEKNKEEGENQIKKLKEQREAVNRDLENIRRMQETAID